MMNLQNITDNTSIELQIKYVEHLRRGLKDGIITQDEYLKLLEQHNIIL